jgi:3-hydroxy-9,10-secoandrosta-1,3,5(10)-triene-9,17-dione monooxygenase
MHAPDRDAAIVPPEPGLTPAELLSRASALIPLLRERQAECERLGMVMDDVNAELIRGGFYRLIQPRRFGGYEFDVPTFYRVMMEISRGCPETGWVLALTAGHPLIVASFPLEGQREVYGREGEFRCPAAFNPPGTAVPVAGGFRVSGSWPSASGIDHGTHALTAARVEATQQIVFLLLERDQFRIVDDWQVMGMQGTGSKRVAVDEAVVPLQRTLEGVGPGRPDPKTRPRLLENPMYIGRVPCFLIGEAASVAVGAARGALDLYEETVRSKRAYHPPYHERSKEPEFQHHYGRALALVSTAEAALVRAGEDYMDFAREQASGGAAFDEERDLRLVLVEQQCIRLAWEATDLIYRTVGTSDAAREGKMIGRIFRNMAVINTHPGLQSDRTAIMAARMRFGLMPPAG